MLHAYEEGVLVTAGEGKDGIDEAEEEGLVHFYKVSFGYEDRYGCEYKLQKQFTLQEFSYHYIRTMKLQIGAGR